MTTAQLILTLTILVTLVLVFQITLAGLLFLSWKRFKTDERALKYAAKKLSQQLLDIFRDVETESKNLILDTQAEAHQMLVNLPLISKTLEKNSQDLAETLKTWQRSELPKLQKTYTESIQKAIDITATQTDQALSHSIAAFEQALNSSLQEQLQTLSAERTKILTQTQTHLDGFTEQQKKEVASKAEAILTQVITNVLHTQLSPEDQHNLVLGQIEEAWQKGMLKS